MRLRLAVLVISLAVIGGGLAVASLVNKKTDGLSFQATTDQAAPTTQVKIGTKTFQTELATTPQQKATGLSNRPSLPQNAGMLFVFKPKEIPAMWMKGMEFPIDFVWISDGKVADVSSNAAVPAPGATTDDLIVYRPKAPVDYVLEINAGQADKFNIGDIVEISNSQGV